MKRSFLWATVLLLCCNVVVQPPAHAERETQFETISDEDWRSTTPRIPWSTPVIVKDDFTGDYLAVFDRNFDDRRRTEEGVVSNWSRSYIRIFVYHKQRRCGVIPVFCNTTNTEVYEADRLQIKLGELVFTVDGVNGNFPVSEDLAEALASAPTGVTKIRLTLEESGAVITNDIGEDTVRAWRVVYSSQSAN